MSTKQNLGKSSGAAAGTGNGTPEKAYRHRAIGDHVLRPETLMMSYGYDPRLSEGAVKCPIFLTSTFVFKSAEEGKAFFELAYGLREKRPVEEMGTHGRRRQRQRHDLGQVHPNEVADNRITITQAQGITNLEDHVQASVKRDIRRMQTLFHGSLRSG